MIQITAFHWMKFSFAFQQGKNSEILMRNIIILYLNLQSHSIGKVWDMFWIEWICPVRFGDKQSWLTFSNKGSSEWSYVEYFLNTLSNVLPNDDEKIDRLYEIYWLKNSFNLGASWHCPNRCSHCKLWGSWWISFGYNMVSSLPDEKPNWWL